MKIIITLALLYAFYNISLSQDPLAETKKFVKDCIAANKAKKEDFEKFADNLNSTDIPQSMKCAMKCFMEKNGYFGMGSTTIRAKAFIAKLSTHTPVDDIQNGLDQCTDLEGANACERSYLIMTCMWANNIMNRSRIVMLEKNELSPA